jgi:hypothetical protein
MKEIHNIIYIIILPNIIMYKQKRNNKVFDHINNQFPFVLATLIFEYCEFKGVL